jgi:hypothetical protein
VLRRLIASALIASLATPSLVRADDAADVAAARELGTAGVLLADGGKCDEAIDKLSRAEKLHHAPTILGRLGECQVDVGRLVEGTENLQRVVREPLGPNAPTAFVQAVERAKKVLVVAEPKIARLTLFVEPDAATVTIDGVAVPQAAIGTARPIDPGSHVVDVRAPGYTHAMQTVTLNTSQVASVTIKLEKLPEPIEPTEPEPPAPPPKKVEPEPPPVHIAPPPSEGSATRTIGTVSFVIGGVALAAGATFGLFALDRKNALDRACNGTDCPEDARDTLDAAQRWAVASTVCFVVGGAAITAGGVLLLMSSSEKKHSSVRPMIGFGTIGLGGEF